MASVLLGGTRSLQKRLTGRFTQIKSGSSRVRNPLSSGAYFLLLGRVEAGMKSIHSAPAVGVEAGLRRAQAGDRPGSLSLLLLQDGHFINWSKAGSSGRLFLQRGRIYILRWTTLMWF